MRDPGSEDNHVFAKVKSQLQENIVREQEKDKERSRVSRFVDPSNKAYGRLKSTVYKTLC